MLVVFYPTLYELSILYMKKWYDTDRGDDRMKPLKEKVSITLDADIVKIIKEKAEMDDRSFSQFINKILKEYLHTDKKQ